MTHLMVGEDSLDTDDVFQPVLCDDHDDTFPYWSEPSTRVRWLLDAALLEYLDLTQPDRLELVF